MTPTEERVVRTKAARDYQPVARIELKRNNQAVMRIMQAFKTEMRRLFDSLATQVEERISGRVEDRIKTRLASLKDGQTPTNAELLALIRPLIKQPKDGKTPSREELLAIIEPLIPQVENGEDGENGKDADEDAILDRLQLNLPQLGHDIRNALELLQEGDRLSVNAIHGLDDVLAAWLKKSLAGYGEGGGTSFSLQQSGTQKVQQPTTLNFTGAGAPTITHRQSGVTDISFPSGTGLTELLPTETPDGVRTVFTFPSATGQPRYVVRDNTTMRPTSKSGTVNWTWNNGTKQATLTTPAQDDCFALI